MVVTSNDPTVIDLFAGAGGLSLGAARAGFNVACVAEYDLKALDTHERNFPLAKHLNVDLAKTTPKLLCELAGIIPKQITGVIGGPPCQGFSAIGHQRQDDERNNLFIKFFSFVNKLKPTFFVAENVLGIMDDKFEIVRETAFNKLRNYNILPPMVVKASDFGAPTIRTRVFFIGYDPKRMPELSHDDFSRLKTPCTDQIYVREALKGLPVDTSSFNNGAGTITLYHGNKETNTAHYHARISGNIPKGIGDKVVIENYLKHHIVTGCIPTIHSKRVLTRYTELKYGQQDAISKSVKLDPDGFCPTIRAGTGPEKGSFQAVRPIHYEAVRVITPREAARLQGFPDWFDFQPTIWHSFRQIGNSVSPIVAEKILSAIYQKLI